MNENFRRGLENSPTMRFIRENEARARRMVEDQQRIEAETARATAMIAAQRRAKVERERVTADSTAAVAAWAREQSEENRRLRYLTNILAFAVIYGVVNDSFDDHTWWTTLLSATVAVVVMGGALLLGRWRHRRQAARDEDSGSPA